MKLGSKVSRAVSSWCAIAALASSSAAQAFPKMDETWTVSVNGQLAQVRPDGSFSVPNVSAADQFGAGGPGTSPDFVSDDYIRAIGTTSAGGVTRYAYSARFRFRVGQPFSVGHMTVIDGPPPFPQSINATADDPIVTVLGQHTQIRVTGYLIDGSSLDVSTPGAGTTYRTSNPAVLSVDENGSATANGAGIAFVTALNEGAAAVVQVIVAPGDPLTTVVGHVVDDAGLHLSGAIVTIVGQGASSKTGRDGAFSITSVATTLGDLRVQATLGNLRGTSRPVAPEPGMVTDAGIIVATPVRDVLVFGDQLSERSLLSVELTSLGRVVTNVQVLPTDLSKFGTIWHVGAFVAFSAAERARLAAFLGQGGGLHLTGEWSCCETMNDSIELFLNSVVTQGGIGVGGLGSISGPYNFNQGTLGGVAVNPNLLTTWAPSAAGGLSGLGSLPDRNILVTGAAQRPVGGIWECSDLAGGQGRMTLLMDSNWLSNVARRPIIENIQTFLELGACGP